LVPPPKPGGNKRSVDIREVVNGVMYLLSTGCQWRGRIVATRAPI
jgi:transposase